MIKIIDTHTHLDAEEFDEDRAEAFARAKEAGVGQLICTHIWGGRDMAGEILAEARRQFPNTLVAEEMHEYFV